MTSERLNAVPEVDIDDSGRFKYILIKLYDGSLEKCIVRGYHRAEYHADIYEEVEQRISGLGVECECVGGGRIEHNPDKGRVFVYGYSQGFGRADHAKTVELLKRKFPNYSDITFKNEGY